MKQIKRFLPMLLAFTLMVSSLCIIPAYTSPTEVQAATVSLSKKTLNLVKGKSATLKLNGATASKVKWSTSSKKIATVSSKGKVTAKGVGKATVTAKYSGKSYKCTVCVRKSSLSVNKSSISLDPKKSINITVTLKSNEYIYFKSSDGNIVTGKWSQKWKNNKTTLTLTAQKPGSAKVYVYTDKKSYFAIDVKVKAPWDGVKVIIPETIGEQGTECNRMQITKYTFFNPGYTIYEMKIDFKMVKYGKTGRNRWGTYFYCYDKNGNLLDEVRLSASNIALNKSFTNTVYIPNGTAIIEFIEYPETNPDEVN